MAKADSRKLPEAFKSGLRNIVRVYLRTPLRGKTRLRSLTDPMLAPAGMIERRRVGPCHIPLSHAFEATRSMAYGAYESREIAALRKVVKRGDIVADVGANVGYMAAHFSGMVGREGKVFAFEPSPTPLGVLHQTAESCVYRNIEIVPSAASNRNGSAKFFETEAALSRGFSRIDHRPSDRHVSTEIGIPVTRLDSFFATFDARRLSLVKIDAEGHERQCIEGLAGLLDAGHRPTLMTEASGNKKGIAEFLRIATLLKAFGYAPLDLSFKPIDARALGPNFHGNVLWKYSSSRDKREARHASVEL